MPLFLRCLVASVLAASAAFQPAPASAQPVPELRVATRALPPIVVESPNGLSGFSVDLWNAIATRMGVKTVWQIAPDIGALLDLVRTGQADLGISAISITPAREAEVDFKTQI